MPRSPVRGGHSSDLDCESPDKLGMGLVTFLGNGSPIVRRGCSGFLASLRSWGVIVPHYRVAHLESVAIGAFLAGAPAEGPAAGVPLRAGREGENPMSLSIPFPVAARRGSEVGDWSPLRRAEPVLVLTGGGISRVPALGRLPIYRFGRGICVSPLRCFGFKLLDRRSCDIGPSF
ncbi:hypothetical protein GW17_00041839 [Ensete ventricosum]|nr:hypothetical protein GW17_00041839 [Ensete ventricosum]